MEQRGAPHAETTMWPLHDGPSMLLVSKLKAMTALETKPQQFATDLKSDAVIPYNWF